MLSFKAASHAVGSISSCSLPPTTMVLSRVAILDDYQGVALTSADWTPLDGRVHIDVFRDTLLDEDALVKRLENYDVASRLIATTGPANRGIDTAYAKEKGIVVSETGGGGNSTLEHIWALILSTVRYTTVEDANIKSRNPQWQSTMPLGLAGRTIGLIGLGRFGTMTAKARNIVSILTKLQLITILGISDS
ncbi:unnamed protein product [Cyclocybe aegerita]|uniref:Uncharacterized protein n=1 Tax=Cyclocybe aegerita TaxID=1973307 RepID=A0A8S0W667_CYCAE|nr:unnamed protein product [Cyclocybe aegerita]